MAAHLEDPADEIKRLLRGMNDLLGVLSLSAIWTGQEPSQAVRTLLDALWGVLRLDFLFARWMDPSGAGPMELVRLDEGWEPALRPGDIGEALHRWLGDGPEQWPAEIQKPFGDGHLAIATSRLGLRGELGLIVAGSQRADFPTQTERLVLSLAANQAAIGLQWAALLSEQKRISSELDRRVAKLAETNEKLRKEIIDRRRTEEVLQASERELSLTVNTIPALAWSARADGSVEFFNQHYLAYVGLPLEQLRGSGWTIAVHPDDLGTLMTAWQSMMATGKAGEVEGRLRRFDGEYRWFLFRMNPTLDEAGHVLKWYGTNSDIDGRKRAEEQLRRSEAFLTEGQKLSGIGNFSWLVATDEIKWSEQLYRIFEFERGVPVRFELIGSRVHPEDFPLLVDMIGKAQRGVSDFEYEHRLLMPDRSIKYLHLIGHRSRDRHGPPEYIGAVQDVTQRRLSEKALDKARSELANVARMTSLGVLTASIAHEVNQPLSGIVTNASTCLRMLAADPPNVEAAREIARRTIRDGNRAADVVARLRTLYSKEDISTESIDLNEATREVVLLSLNELHSKGVVLRHEFADDLPPVIGDRVQLQQVILNLLRNAADAMDGVEDRPRDLLIKTQSDEGDRVRLSVKDAGVGFDPQAADKLFQAFFTTKRDGMGVGLSVSRSIIESHSGRLWAVRNDGPGATFSFSIPCRRTTATAASSASAI